MIERLHLSPKHRAVIEALLREHLPGVEVWAYGSRVNGRSHDGSDLDLVLRGPGLQQIPVDQVADFEEAVRDSSIPFLVEARDWPRLPERFHREIERGYVVLVEGGRSTVVGESDDWFEYMLGELTDNFDSVRVPVKQAERRPGPYPYYGASGIVDHIAGYLFDGEYLLVAEDGENLRTRNTPVAFLVNGKFWVNNHAHIVRGNHKADTRYLMYALSNLDISGYLTGSTMPKLTQGNMNRIRVLTPPLPEQRAIAHILGTLDDKIELNRRMNETLETMARALFKSWFVDFDPARAKAALRGGSDWSVERAHAYLDRMDPGIAALFPAHFVDSELGKIPTGWEVFRLDELVDHHTKSMTPSAFPEATFEHFSIPAYDSSQLPAIDRGLAIKSNKVVVPLDAVLLSKLNPEISRVWIPDKPNGCLQICSTEFLAFTPRCPANRSLLFLLFTDPDFRTVLQSMVTGTSKSHQRVAPKALKQTAVLSGTPALFDRFGTLVVPMLARIVKNRAESRALAALRDVLLPKLVAGELRIHVEETFR